MALEGREKWGDVHRTEGEVGKIQNWSAGIGMEELQSLLMAVCNKEHLS